MSPTIELIYESTCPNAEGARDRIREALKIVGMETTWIQWDQDKPDSPAYAKSYGSPTILIDGEDIAGLPPGAGSACRIYSDTPGKQRGVPPLEMLVSALSLERVAGEAFEHRIMPGMFAAECHRLGR